jgi:hypothetical protein
MRCPNPINQTLIRDIQELKDEQRRSREEQERLRHQGNGSNGDHTDTKREHSEQDARKNQRDGNEPGKNGHQEEPQSDGQKHDGQNEPKEQPKPPLKERVRVYVRTHQKQVAIGAVGFVVLCIAGILLLRYLRSYESTDDAQVDGHLNAGVVAAQATADAAQKAIEQRRAQLAQVQARLNESKQNAPRIVAIRQASTEARQAAVLTVRSQLEQATLNLSYTKILRLPPASSPANPWRLASEWSPASNC